MTPDNDWHTKTLGQLELKDYGDPRSAPTPLARRCVKLCKVPVGEFNIEQLRLMIGQKFSLIHLVPLAIKQLQKDLFAAGDFFPGDLLKNVLMIQPAFWKKNRQLWGEVSKLIEGKEGIITDRKIPVKQFQEVFLGQ